MFLANNLREANFELEASRKKRAEIETAIEKKKLEQELLDAQLALKLAEIEESDESSESNGWMEGHLPWDYQQDPALTWDDSNVSSGKNELKGYEKIIKKPQGRTCLRPDAIPDVQTVKSIDHKTQEIEILMDCTPQNSPNRNLVLSEMRSSASYG
ncbi:hypothetical protein JTB14_036128 [Gonioctena quinquepunctata]|nr:hypothetical protein JTB14_036128 [Gonioctena quinquepunctata]